MDALAGKEAELSFFSLNLRNKLNRLLIITNFPTHGVLLITHGATKSSL